MTSAVYHGCNKETSVHLVFSATILTPVNLTVDDADITATSLRIQWQMLNQSISWKYNVSCSGVQSSNQQTQTELTTMTASFTSLISGDEYNISVTAYFTNDIGEMYDGTQTMRQAIGKLLQRINDALVIKQQQTLKTDQSFKNKIDK